MADNTLSILKPSVNNLSVRIFVRAAGLDFEEVDVWGQQGPTSSPPRTVAPDAAARVRGPAARRALGELRDHAVPLQQARPRALLSDRPGKRAMVDSAMAYHLATLYPLVARATYPSLGFGQYAGRSGRRPRRRTR